VDLGLDFCFECWWNIDSKGIEPTYSPVFDGERFAQVRDVFENGQNGCQALSELNINQSRRRDQVNEHKFKVGNRVQIRG
jgi:hypothetical protein